MPDMPLADGDDIAAMFIAPIIFIMSIMFPPGIDVAGIPDVAGELDGIDPIFMSSIPMLIEPLFGDELIPGIGVGAAVSSCFTFACRSAICCRKSASLFVGGVGDAADAATACIRRTKAAARANTLAGLTLGLMNVFMSNDPSV